MTVKKSNIAARVVVLRTTVQPAHYKTIMFIFWPSGRCFVSYRNNENFVVKTKVLRWPVADFMIFWMRVRGRIKVDTDEYNIDLD